MKKYQLPDDNQRSKDWRIERLGNFTGSRIADLMKSGRKKDETFGDTAKALIYEVMAERDLSSITIGNEEIWQQYLDLTSVTNKAMRFGTDNEEDALNEFLAWFKKNNADSDKYELVRTGSIPHAEIPNFAASPDAVLVEKETGVVMYNVEIKCPLPKTFMKYKAEIKDADTLKSAIEQYYYQVHAEMMVTETDSTYFVCYCPFLIHGLHVATIEMNAEVCNQIQERLGLAEEYILKIKNDDKG